MKLYGEKYSPPELQQMAKELIHSFTNGDAVDQEKARAVIALSAEASGMDIVETMRHIRQFATVPNMGV